MSVQVQVKEGVLEGEVLQNKYGGSYYSFKGIPYAQPPIGDLRFKAPLPPKAWKGVRSAKQFAPKCYQFDWFTGKEDSGSEDCLYLNIYTPDIKPNKPLPVMFWIHGGAYMSGSGDDDFYGPECLVRQGVILVTINYRLEILGFLSLDTEDVPGNAGLKDQVEALSWVNKNIVSFGGDPNNITIFGESAGGASVTYHLISPMTKGLFHRAIAQSGTCLNHWAQGFEMRDRALALARKLGCYSEDDKELYNFFKRQPVEVLVKAMAPVTYAEKQVIEKNGILFSVVNEKKFAGQESFFSGDIVDAISNNIHSGIDIMVGYTADEGLIMIKTGDYIKNHLDLARNFPEYFISEPVSLDLSVRQMLELGKKIRKFYFNDFITIPDDWPKLVKYFGMDMLFLDIMQWTKLCANTKRNKVYFYNFSCKSKRNMVCRLFGIEGIVGDKQVTNHMDELMYLFEPKVLNPDTELNSEEFKLIDKVTKLWTNFAKFGNPTPDDALGVKWTPFTLEDEAYMDIGNELVPGTKHNHEELEYFGNLFKEYGQRVYI